MSRDVSGRKIKAFCPQCGYQVDEASHIDGDDVRPEPDNIALCIMCAGIGIYFAQEDGTLGLRLPTDEERSELDKDEQITKVRATIIAMSR
jgi:hypothetical protein